MPEIPDSLEPEKKTAEAAISAYLEAGGDPDELKNFIDEYYKVEIKKPSLPEIKPLTEKLPIPIEPVDTSGFKIDKSLIPPGNEEYYNRMLENIKSFANQWTEATDLTIEQLKGIKSLFEETANYMFEFLQAFLKGGVDFTKGFDVVYCDKKCKFLKFEIEKNIRTIMLKGSAWSNAMDKGFFPIKYVSGGLLHKLFRNLPFEMWGGFVHRLDDVFLSEVPEKRVEEKKIRDYLTTNMGYSFGEGVENFLHFSPKDKIDFDYENK